MVTHWIFVSVPFTDFNVGTVEDIFKNNTNKKWIIGKNTPYREKLTKGDKILFYQGGTEDGGKIVASAEVGSSLQSEDFNNFIIINNFKFWLKPVYIKTLIEKLSFIKNKKYWGLHFQGGIIKLNENDYNKILKKAKYLV